MIDTRPEAQRVMDEIVRQQSPAERLAIALQWSDTAREVALEALRHRFPNETLLSLMERLAGEPYSPGVRSGPLPRHLAR
jgi:hypothetical protein